MNADSKNLILAIALSIAIIAGWQYFYIGPMLEEQQKQTETNVTTTTTPGPVTPSPDGTAKSTREEALAKSPRVKIDTPTLEGSIALKGAMIDDLKLKNYRETIDPKSPIITYLSPSGAPGALFAEHGWMASDGTKVPAADTLWTASAGATLTPETPLALTWDNGQGFTFTRTVSIDENYLFTVKQEVRNAGNTAALLTPFARIQRQGQPFTEGIWVLWEGPHGVLGGEEQRHYYEDVRDASAPITVPSTGGWAGFTDKYWAVTLIPDQKSDITGEFVHQATANGPVFQADYLARTPVPVGPGATASYQSNLYAGAKIAHIIDGYHDKLGIQNFDLMIDWGWFYWITKPLYYLLHWLHGVLGNFGLAILAITVIVKLLFFPLQNKAYASMSKMKKLQPKIEEMRARYKDDKVKQQQELIALYKTENVSPLSGCLPILLSIPVFFALYKVIYTTIELRHAPFYGWIKDLSVGDPSSIFNLFGLLPFDPPQFLVLGVWPILMGITMWIQMRLNPTPPDPIQAAMFNWMPLIFTFMLASFPAGLVIYWAWSNLLGILQQSYIMKRHGVEVNLFGNIRDSLPFLKRKTAG